MKLYVEIDEKDVQIKLDELIGKRVAHITDMYIQERVAAVVNKKIDRIKTLESEDIMKKACLERLGSEFGSPKTYNSKLGAMIRETALGMLTEQFDRTGVKG
jgi:hypothetical protein